MKKAVLLFVLVFLLPMVAMSATDNWVTAFSRWDSIWIGNADGSTQKRVVNTPSRFAGCPSLSPSGRFVAFSSSKDGGGIYIFDTKSDKEYRLTTGPFDYHPTWSPAGNSIAFCRGGSGDKIYTVPARNFQRPLSPKRLTKLPLWVAESNPCWAGNLIVFDACTRKYQMDGYYLCSIMAKNTTTGEEFTIVEEPNLDIHDPSVSVDGKVAYEVYDTPNDYYSTERLKKARIFWKTIGTPGPGTPLCYDEWQEVHGQAPCWSPTGEGIYYESVSHGTFFKISIMYNPLVPTPGISVEIGGAYAPSVIAK